MFEWPYFNSIVIVARRNHTVLKMPLSDIESSFDTFFEYLTNNKIIAVFLTSPRRILSGNVEQSCQERIPENIVPFFKIFFFWWNMNVNTVFLYSVLTQVFFLVLSQTYNLRLEFQCPFQIFFYSFKIIL